ncbi:MAG: hypothetical protein IKN81_06400 [Oscillospiraceae bacterium]|nr:hypothetical protein [Oscillospiraceae bacterium]
MERSLEALAKANEPMPENLSLTDQAAYQAIACLAVRFRLKAVTAEQAIKEKAQIDKAFARRTADDAFVNWNVRLRKRIKRAHARYRLERTIEAADYLSGVIDGFIRED